MNRNLSIDILKYIMALMVVGLHMLLFMDISPVFGSIFVNGVARLAVPAFLIISGYYFANITEKEQFYKWMRRLLFLFLIWNTFYTVLFADPLTTSSVIKSYTSGYYHLWYLIHSFYAYFIIWAIRKLSTIKLVGILVICAFIGLVLEYVFLYEDFYNLPFKINFRIWIFRNFLFDCLPFILIGYLINKNKISASWVQVLLGIIFGLALLIAEALLNFYHSNKIVDILCGLYILAPSLFLLFQKLKIHSEKKNFSVLATGIYLTHVIYINLPLESMLHIPNRLVLYLLVLFLSHISTYLLIFISRKVRNPITKYWL